MFDVQLKVLQENFCVRYRKKGAQIPHASSGRLMRRGISCYYSEVVKNTEKMFTLFSVFAFFSFLFFFFFYLNCQFVNRAPNDGNIKTLSNLYWTSVQLTYISIRTLLGLMGTHDAVIHPNCMK